MKRFVSLVTALLILAASTAACGKAEKPAAAVDSSMLIAREAETERDDSYSAYLRRYSREESDATENITLSVKQAKDEKGLFEWELPAAESGFYDVVVRYLPHPVNDEDGTTVAFKLNGEAPYSELDSVKLPDEYCDTSPLIQDKYGNDLRPEQVPAERMTENYLYDTALTYAQPLGVYLTGKNDVLELEIISGTAEIDSVILKPVNQIKPYQKVKEEYGQKGYTEVKGALEIYQAENTAY